MAYGSVLTDTVQSSTASTAPVFKDGNGTQIGTLCRAWVNFNGTGTVAIRGSFNVSSITDNGTGSYTVNFTNAMPDTNYSAVASTYDSGVVCLGIPATTSIPVITRLIQGASGTAADYAYIFVSIFR